MPGKIEGQRKNIIYYDSCKDYALKLIQEPQFLVPNKINTFSQHILKLCVWGSNTQSLAREASMLKSSLRFLILSTCLRTMNYLLSVPSQVTIIQVAVTNVFYAAVFVYSFPLVTGFLKNIPQGFLLDLQNSTAHSAFPGERSSLTFIQRIVCARACRPQWKV